jgi:hypothetical protein
MCSLILRVQTWDSGLRPSVATYIFVCVCVCVKTVDAKRKGVKLAAHYSKFVDLLSEYSRTYPRLAQLGGGNAALSLHR